MKKRDQQNLVYLAGIIRSGAGLAEIQYTANQILGVGGCGNFDKGEHDNFDDLVSR